MNYTHFIQNKRSVIRPSGFSIPRQSINEGLFEFQIELKESYYKMAVRNLDMSVQETIDDLLS
jgi:hypothetical protein